MYTPVSRPDQPPDCVAPQDWSLAEDIEESNIIVMADVFGGSRVNVSESGGLGRVVCTTAWVFGKG